MELLKSENAKLRKENRILKEKIKSMTCPTCNSKMLPKKDNSTPAKYISQVHQLVHLYQQINLMCFLQLLLSFYSFSLIS